MAESFTVRVEGIRELVAALSVADVEAQKALKDELRKAGEAIRLSSQEYTDGLNSPESALGYRVYARQGGARIDVEQSLRKTTGLRPDWGATQMRYSLIPSLKEHEDETFAAVEAALEHVTTSI